MPNRPDLVADAAVTVLARDGLRGLTHRAVDAEAGLPVGSASNCFRSRLALLTAVVGRIEELDLAVLDGVARPDPSAVAAVGDYLARIMQAMASPQQVRATRARFALVLDETARPSVEAGHRRFVAMLSDLLEAGGHTDPPASAAAITHLLEGTLLHAVAIDASEVDPAAVSRAVQRLLG